MGTIEELNFMRQHVHEPHKLYFRKYLPNFNEVQVSVSLNGHACSTSKSRTQSSCLTPALQEQSKTLRFQDISSCLQFMPMSTLSNTRTIYSTNYELVYAHSAFGRIFTHYPTKLNENNCIAVELCGSAILKLLLPS